MGMGIPALRTSLIPTNEILTEIHQRVFMSYQIDRAPKISLMSKMDWPGVESIPEVLPVSSLKISNLRFFEISMS